MPNRPTTKCARDRTLHPRGHAGVQEGRPLCAWQSNVLGLPLALDLCYQATIMLLSHQQLARGAIDYTKEDNSSSRTAVSSSRACPPTSTCARARLQLKLLARGAWGAQQCEKG
eukprot:1157390-Pelagomonas_calceolata.AAC.11